MTSEHLPAEGFVRLDNDRDAELCGVVSTPHSAEWTVWRIIHRELVTVVERRADADTVAENRARGHDLLTHGARVAGEVGLVLDLVSGHRLGEFGPSSRLPSEPAG